MNKNKIYSTLVIGMILVLISSALVPTFKAAPPAFHAVKGILYIDGEIYDSDPIEVRIDIEGSIFSDYTFPFDGHYNYNVGIGSIDKKTGDISVFYSGIYRTPVDNSTVYIHEGEPVEIYLDLHIITSGNNPPNTPTKISPGSSTSDTTPDLKWSGGDPDPGDTVTYDVYFGDTNPPPKVVGNQSGTTYSPGALEYKTYYWKIIAWDNHGVSTEGPIWQFLVKKSSSGGGGSTGGGTGGGPVTISPTADAGGPYSGFINEEISFDGTGSTDSDGTITDYTWDFGDGNTGTGATPTNVYSNPGNYIVTLTVKDDTGDTDSDQTTVDILVPNNPPEEPLITVMIIGNISTPYEFFIISTDRDNDSIQYIIDWGDGSDINTDFLPNGTSVTLNHTWNIAGNYTMKVTAYDNKTVSSAAEYLVIIEAEIEPEPEETTEEDYTWLILILVIIIILIIIGYLIGKGKKPKKK